MTIRFHVPGAIRGKGRPRFARRGPHVRAYTDDATVSAEALVRLCAAQAGITMADGPVALRIRVAVEVPASWSRKKRDLAMAGRVLPTSKPDLDNVIKLVADALNKVAWRDDSQVVSVLGSKHYAVEPGADIEIEPLVLTSLRLAAPVEPLR